MSRILITGANSGIGYATSLLLAEKGHQVWAGVRKLEKAKSLIEVAQNRNLSVHVIQLDVNDDSSVKRAVDQMIRAAGAVDVLINNAGVGGSGVVEDVDIDLGKAIFETNFWGVIRCTQAVLPSMREQGGGQIINLTSFLGRLAGLGQLVYSASKWSVESLSESLAQEVGPLGVRVSIIEPGSTHSRIIENAINSDHTPSEISSAYESFYRRTTRLYEHGWSAAAQPQLVARTILQAMEDSSPRLRYTCAWGAETLISARSKMSDEDWVSLGSFDTDGGYYAHFEKLFGIDISFPAKFEVKSGWRARFKRLMKGWLSKF